MNTRQQTLCWDCKNALGFCSWSQNFEPVKGWKAIPTKKMIRDNLATNTFIVTECPKFIRDATNSGLKRYEKDDKNDTMRNDS